MRVYRYLNAEYGMRSLRERRLRISRLIELNDPFEFLCVETSDRKIRAALHATKDEISEKNGILSFSRIWSSPVMWAHYSQQHTGLCLGFDVPQPPLDAVRYTKTRIKFPSTVDMDFVKGLLFTKFAHWSYEQEYRAFANLGNSIGGNYYLDFSESLVLRQVIVGCNSAVSRGEVKAAIKGINKEIDYFKVRPAHQTFQIVRNQNDKLWL